MVNMGLQSAAFLNTEGNRWYERNKDKPREEDQVCALIKELKIEPKSVLEVGCSMGRRLRALNKQYDCFVCGVDPSTDAIRHWLKQKNAHGVIGTATSLPGGNDRFDLVIFGFCLYVCDREDLFKIVAETDRVLQDQGHLVIHDFFSEAPHSRRYSHYDGLRSYKMDYAKLWLANPAYSLVRQQVYDAEPHSEFQGDDNKYAVSILKKDIAGGFPLVS